MSFWCHRLDKNNQRIFFQDFCLAFSQDVVLQRSYSGPMRITDLFQNRDHQFKTSANLRDFEPYPIGRQYFTTVRRQISIKFDPSPPPNCQRL